MEYVCVVSRGEEKEQNRVKSNKARMISHHQQTKLFCHFPHRCTEASFTVHVLISEPVNEDALLSVARKKKNVKAIKSCSGTDGPVLNV